MIKGLRKLADWLECNKARAYSKWNKWLDSKKVNVQNCKTCICGK
jgi:hypothetical protein